MRGRSQMCGFMNSFAFSFSNRRYSSVDMELAKVVEIGSMSVPYVERRLRRGYCSIEIKVE